VNGNRAGTARSSTSASGKSTYFGIASLQKSYDNLNFQLSAFARYSSLSYQPDAFGDLLYNGIAPWTKRTSFATGVQGDGSWKVSDAHTLRGGFLVQRERVTSFTQGNTLPLVPDPDDPDAPAIPGDQPFGLTDSSDLTGWTYSVYLQDEWKLLPTLTVNGGLRFDAITGTIARTSSARASTSFGNPRRKSPCARDMPATSCPPR
jgi:outer membrane receptor protein involved in Fe transport